MKNLIKFIIAIIFISFVLVTTSSCKGNKIDAPTNITTDENNQLVWDSVEEAKMYNIQFYYVDGDTTFTNSTRKLTFSLNELEVGDYEIRLQSVSGIKGKKDSALSEVIYFHKYFETGCQYSLINNNTEYQVTKVGKATGTFTIENYYRGKAVTKVADNAFKGNTKVVDITLGENIITIGSQAFYNCSKLERLILPTNVTNIGRACFQSCRSLKEIIIPDSIDTLPEFAFAYCRSLTKAVIGNNVKTIEQSCFQDCSALLEINIPDSVETIGEYCFSACINVTKINIGSGLQAIDNFSFYKCTALKVINFSENNNVKSTGEQSFSDCIALEEVVLPGGFEEIGYASFYNDELLNNVIIPASCKHVGAYSFVNTKLYKDQIEAGNDFVYADNWLVGCSTNVKTTLEAITTETLKDTIVGIADAVFQSCEALKTVIFPASFKYIGEKAFYGCPNLWKLWTLTDSIEEIGNYAFANCVITNLILGDGLKKIGNYAFYGNPQLDNNATNPQYLIPESVTSVGTLAFKNTKLWNSSEGNIVQAANWVIGFKEDNLGSVTLEFDTTKVAGIADYAFYNATSLRTIQGLNSCRYIGKGAFQGCENLTSVSLNRNLTEIKDFTFYGCSNLIKVTLPRTLTKVGNYAFFKCSLLSEINLESTNCASIGKSAFYINESLKELSFSKQTTSIGDYAFYKCASLQEIILPEKLEKLGIKAFFKCENLKKVELNNNLKVIPESAFNSCSLIEEINIPDSVEKIEKSAFYRCSNAATLKLGNNVKSIGDYAFYELSKITELNLPDSLESIGNYTFKGLTNVKVLILKDSVLSIGQHAFYGCKELTIYTNATSLLGLWHKRFNSGYRPIFWGTEFDENNKVKSINYSPDTAKNLVKDSIINVPNIENKTFKCWIDENNNEYQDLFNLEYNGLLKPIYE